MKYCSYVLIAIFTFALSALTVTFSANAGTNVTPTVSFSTTDEYPKTDGSGGYELLPDNMYSSATIQFFSKPADIDKITAISFEYMTCDDDGDGSTRNHADGVAVVLGQDPSIYSDSAMQAGGGLGVITGSGGNGISIRFNTYDMENITVRDSYGTIKNQSWLSTYTSCNWSAVTISISGNELIVVKDGIEVLSATLTQAEVDAISQYQIGFSATTGGADSAHKIRNVFVGSNNVTPTVSFSTTTDYPKGIGYNEYELLPDNMYSSASIHFFLKPEDIDTVTAISFEYMTCDDNGEESTLSRADGVAVVLGQDPSIYSDTALPAGGALGVITGSGGNGVSIRFITHREEKIEVRDDAGNIKTRSLYSTYTSCNWSAVTILISGNELKVVKDCIEVLSATLTQAEVDAISQYQVGFSAATGAADSAHIIRNIHVSGTAHKVSQVAWTTATIDGGSGTDVGLYSFLKVTKSGKLDIAYNDYTNTNLKYATDRSGSWMNYTLDNSGKTGLYTSLGLGPYSASQDMQFIRHISYFDYENGKLMMAVGQDRTLFNSFNISTVDGGGDSNAGWFSSISTEVDIRPQIAYYDFTNGNLKYASSNGSGFITQTVDGDGETDVGSYCSIINVDADGGCYISYRDDTNKMLKCATNVNGPWTSENVASNGADNSIAIDSNGNLHIAFYDLVDGTLMYVTNRSGSWVTGLVDDTRKGMDSRAVCGRYNSIAVDDSGYVHISYYDDSTDFLDKDLKYATNRSGSWVVTIVDSEGIVGMYTSLALDSSGNVYISYYDMTNGDLKLATYK